MNKKRIMIMVFLAFSVVLFGCEKPGDIEENQKKSFLLETELAQDISNELTISKPGKILGSQDIVVSAQAMGRVEEILVKEGDEVIKDQTILKLKDTIANYGLASQRAKASLDSAILNYEQAKITLNKSVLDTELALEQAKNSYQTTQSSSLQSLKQAQQSFNVSDAQSDSLKFQFPIQKTNILNILNDTLHNMDTLLGVTDKYKSYNDGYDIYLGAKDSSQKNLAKSALITLYKTQEQVENLPGYELSNEDIINNVATISQAYEATKNLLDLMEQVLKNSVASTSLSQTTIDGHLATINGLQTTISANEAGFVAYRSSVQSSFDETKDVSQNSAEIGFETTRINVESSIFNAEKGVQNAQNAYDTATKNKISQLNLLQNTITQARIAYQEVLTQYNKLTIKSPINGTIGSILVDKGQDASNGTPLLTVSSNEDQSIEINISGEEFGNINVGDEVRIEYTKESLTGYIKSISSIANQNTLYKVIVQLQETTKLVGNVATVYIPVYTPYKVLPLNIVTSLKAGEGYIYILENNEPTKYNVQLGKTWGDKIEILNEIPGELEIITTDLSNYDPQKYELKKKE